MLPDIDVEDSTLNVTEGGTTTLRARLTSEPASNVVITASESDSDISVSPASRTFTPSNWNTYQSWTCYRSSGLRLHLDDTATITLTASGGSTDTAIVSVTIADDDDANLPNMALGTISDHEDSTLNSHGGAITDISEDCRYTFAMPTSSVVMEWNRSDH